MLFIMLFNLLFVAYFRVLLSVAFYLGLFLQVAFVSSCSNSFELEDAIYVNLVQFFSLCFPEEIT